MKFVQPKRVLIAVLVCKHSGSTLKISNKEQGAFRQNPKGSVWAEPKGQRLGNISTALSLTHVEQLHHTRSALYKYRPARCKIIQQRSTDPRTDLNRHGSLIVNILDA